jgi:sugar lactone lactonase YvrE
MSMRTEVWAAVLGIGLSCCALCAPAWGAAGTSREDPGTVRTIRKFNPSKSQFPEGVALDKEGNLYVGFYPTGQIVKITPNGKESSFAKLDVGTSGGGMVGFEMDEEDNLFVCDATFEAKTHGIWKVDRKGNTSLFAKLDPSGFPNDLVFDRHGNLFVTDSYLGEIWKISSSGKAEVWLQNRLLNPLFAYGANGIAFDGKAMFVVNTDQGAVIRVKIANSGRPADVELFLQSAVLVGADGISFGARHHAYVTVDFQNVLVQISPQGEIEAIKVLAAAGQGLDFPADTSFAQSQGRRSILFWTSGGYNFNKPSVQELNVEVGDESIY